LSADDRFLNGLIGNQRRAIKFYSFFATSLFVLGVVIILVSLKLHFDQAVKQLNTIIGVGGGFVSSLSALPVKEILSRREKLDLFKAFQLELRNAHEPDISRIREMVWKAVEKTAMG
jgi:hypothetical protein